MWEDSVYSANCDVIIRVSILRGCMYETLCVGQYSSYRGRQVCLVWLGVITAPVDRL